MSLDVNQFRWLILFVSELPKILDAEEIIGSSKDDDDKGHMSAERNFLRNAIMSEPLKSFSQFPPSVYRRTLSATRIQRGKYLNCLH